LFFILWLDLTPKPDFMIFSTASPACNNFGFRPGFFFGTPSLFNALDTFGGLLISGQQRKLKFIN
jgi:hypothetical protein